MPIRSTVKALIVRQGRILLNRCAHEDGSAYYDLPGGGQRPYPQRTRGNTVFRGRPRPCLRFPPRLTPSKASSSSLALNAACLRKTPSDLPGN